MKKFVDHRKKGCNGKKQFGSVYSAMFSAMDRKLSERTLTVYHCRHCEKFHLTTARNRDTVKFNAFKKTVEILGHGKFHKNDLKEALTGLVQ